MNDDDVEEGRVDDGVGAGSNVRIRTEDGGRFTSTRSVPYVYTRIQAYVCGAEPCRTIYTHVYTQCCAVWCPIFSCNSIIVMPLLLHTFVHLCAVPAKPVLTRATTLSADSGKGTYIWSKQVLITHIWSTCFHQICEAQTAGEQLPSAN